MKSEGKGAVIGKASPSQLLTRKAARLRRLRQSIVNIKEKADKRQGEDYQRKLGELQAEEKQLVAEFEEVQAAVREAGLELL